MDLNPASDDVSLYHIKEEQKKMCIANIKGARAPLTSVRRSSNPNASCRLQCP